MYRQSIIGLAWAFIPPIVSAIFWIFLKSQNVFSIPESEIPYTAFVFSGIILWQIFLDALNLPLKMVQQSKSMLVKINFEREAILLAAFYEILFNVLIKLALLIIVFLSLGYGFMLGSVMGVLGVFSLVILGFSISLLLIPAAMLYGDVQRGIGVVSQFAFFLTPIIYPIPSTGFINTIASFNPVAILLDHSRNWIALGNTALDNGFYITVGGSLTVLFGGLILFRLAIPLLIERSGS